MLAKRLMQAVEHIAVGRGRVVRRIGPGEAIAATVASHRLRSSLTRLILTRLILRPSRVIAFNRV